MEIFACRKNAQLATYKANTVSCIKTVNVSSVFYGIHRRSSTYDTGQQAKTSVNTVIHRRFLSCNHRTHARYDTPTCALYSVSVIRSTSSSASTISQPRRYNGTTSTTSCGGSSSLISGRPCASTNATLMVIAPLLFRANLGVLNSVSSQPVPGEGRRIGIKFGSCILATFLLFDCTIKDTMQPQVMSRREVRHLWRNMSPDLARTWEGSSVRSHVLTKSRYQQRSYQ